MGAAHEAPSELPAETPDSLHIGMVCPYSFDEPGGVQAHAIDLCKELQRRGHTVSLIGPGTKRDTVPDFVELGGGSIPIPYNGSVARLSFGPLSARTVRKWIERNGFDVLHIHEPNSPSYSMLSLAQVMGPVVATYHASASESKLLKVVLPLLRPILERIHAGIAVSEEARKWQVENLAGDPVLIPNGVDTAVFREAGTLDGLDLDRPRVMFLGRFDEPRKGLQVLLDAMPAIVDAIPNIELLIAGRGDQDALGERLRKAGLTYALGTDPSTANVRILGAVSEEDKARGLRSSDIYIAPNTGGESFGIVLVEGMAAGAAVVASDIPAFVAVGENGESVALFRNGDAADLTRVVVNLFSDDATRRALAAHGEQRAVQFDWSTVTSRVEEVYRTVRVKGRGVTLA